MTFSELSLSGFVQIFSIPRGEGQLSMGKKWRNLTKDWRKSSPESTLRWKKSNPHISPKWGRGRSTKQSLFYQGPQSHNIWWSVGVCQNSKTESLYEDGYSFTPLNNYNIKNPRIDYLDYYAHIQVLQTMEESFVCIYLLTNMYDTVTSTRHLLFPKSTKFSVLGNSCPLPGPNLNEIWHGCL